VVAREGAPGHIPGRLVLAIARRVAAQTPSAPDADRAIRMLDGLGWDLIGYVFSCCCLFCFVLFLFLFLFFFLLYLAFFIILSAPILAHQAVVAHCQSQLHCGSA
jgi:hypothetical protein